MSEISIRRILVPIDGSDSSMKAARYAIRLASMAKVEIICFHAIPNPPYVEYKAAGLVITRYIEEAKRHGCHGRRQGHHRYRARRGIRS